MEVIDEMWKKINREWQSTSLSLSEGCLLMEV